MSDSRREDGSLFKKLEDLIPLQDGQKTPAFSFYSVRVIDLFAGIGGIRRGFEQAFCKPRGKTDIQVKMVAEIDSSARRTYLANYPEQIVSTIQYDITKVDERDIPNFDICLAGFPCQAFSMAGKHLGFDDPTKGTLFFDVKRICRAKLPKVIFCENVKGLVGHDRGRTFKVIERSFDGIGYKLYAKVLNSRDFGVPQNRERIYLVGIRKDLVRKQEAENLKEFAFPGPTDSSKTIESILQKDVPYKYYMSQRYLDTLKAHRKRHEDAGNGFGYVVRGKEDVAGALMCGGMGRERNLYREDLDVFDRARRLDNGAYHGNEKNEEGIRVMTPREWARLQGFDDGFKLEDDRGPIPETALYKQFGNTVTVSVIRAIAENIKEYLNQFNTTRCLRVLIKDTRVLPWIYGKKRYNLPYDKLTKMFGVKDCRMLYDRIRDGKPVPVQIYAPRERRCYGLCLAKYIGDADPGQLIAGGYPTRPTHRKYALFELDFLSTEPLPLALGNANEIEVLRENRLLEKEETVPVIQDAVHN